MTSHCQPGNYRYFVVYYRIPQSRRDERSSRNHNPVNQKSFTILAAVAIALVSVGIALSVRGVRSIQPDMEDLLQWLPDQSPARFEIACTV